MTGPDLSWKFENTTVLFPWGENMSEKREELLASFESLGADTCLKGDAADATHEYVADGLKRLTDLPAITKEEFEARVGAAKTAYKTMMAPYRRDTHIPIVKPCPAAKEDKQSRYFGRPWMNDDQEWPTSNGKPLHFVLQMDVADLPGKPLGEDGLLLFFHGDGDADTESAIFIADISMPGSLHEVPDSVQHNPSLAIREWRTMPDELWGDDTWDIPGHDEFDGVIDMFGCTIGEYIGLDGKSYNEHKGVLKGILPLAHTFECDKVGGNPRWEQGNDTPKDENGDPMEFILQVGNEGVVGRYDPKIIKHWPVWGRGQLFHSKATAELKFVWACD